MFYNVLHRLKRTKPTKPEINNQAVAGTGTVDTVPSVFIFTPLASSVKKFSSAVISHKSEVSPSVIS